MKIFATAALGLVIFLSGFLAMFILAHYYDAIAYPERLDLSDFDWTGIGALAALLTFAINIALVLTVVVGFRSVREGQVARSAQVLAWATSQMDAVKEDQRLLRESADDFNEWDRKTTEAAFRVANAYQRMCYYARNGLIDIKHFKSMWGINIAIYWLRLENFIKAERKKRNDWPTAEAGAYLRADFEAIALEFIKHFNKSHPKMIATYVTMRTSAPLERSQEEAST